MISIACLVWGAASARSATCEECQELDKIKAVAQQQLTEKEKALEAEFKKKAFQKVTEIRSDINNLRKKLMELEDKSKGCQDACKPDVIKNLECQKLRSEINALETAPSGHEADAKKVDELYRDLRRCNKELRELKSGQK